MSRRCMEPWWFLWKPHPAGMRQYICRKLNQSITFRKIFKSSLLHIKANGTQHKGNLLRRFSELGQLSFQLLFSMINPVLHGMTSLILITFHLIDDQDMNVRFPLALSAFSSTDCFLEKDSRLRIGMT